MSKNNPYLNRIFGLDAVRALAILLVVFGHGSFLLDNTVLAGFPYFPMIDGVTIFFVLSGFLIGSILLKEINATGNFNFRMLATFWKRRWLRTFPNYYLILLANYLVVRYGIIHEDIHQFSWKFFFFLQNSTQPFHGFFWESWSLSVEEWFYILVPILLYFTLKILTPKQSFLLVTITMILLPTFYRTKIFNPATDLFWYDVGIRKIVVTRLDSIAYGLLAAWIFYYFQSHWQKFRGISLGAGIVLLVFILCYEQDVTTFYMQVIYFSLASLAVMLFLPFANTIKIVEGKIANAVTYISKISYSMYLLNFGLVAEVIKHNFAPAGGIDGILKYFVYWIIVLAGSALLYTFFENPIMKLRDK